MIRDIRKTILFTKEIISKIDKDRKQTPFSTYAFNIIENHYEEREQAASEFVSISMKQAVQK